MNSNFADSEEVESTINNSDLLSADDQIVEDLAEMSDKAVDGPIEAAGYLSDYEQYADIVSDESKARTTTLRQARGDHTLVDPFEIAEFREYIRGYSQWDSISAVDDLQNLMEDDNEFSTFTTLEGEVVYVVEDTHSTIAGKFILDDGTDAEDDGIQVTVWKGEDSPDFNVEEGDTVIIDAFAVNLWEGNSQTNIDVESTPASSIIQTDAEFEVGPEEVSLEGTVTGLRNPGDVLFERDLDDGETEWDLRIKAYLAAEDGEEHSIIFNTEEAEEILGMTVDEAKELASQDLGGNPATLAALESLADERVSIETLHYTDNDTYKVTEMEEMQSAADRVAQAAEAAPADD